MDHSVWLGAAAFLGGWLLFVGPVYQAAGELRTQDSLRKDVERVVQEVPVPKRVPTWWWLLPPVALWAQHRRTARFQRDLLHRLTTDQIEQWMRLSERALGWWLVAGGALLLAVYETARFLAELGLGWLAFGSSAVVMSVISLLFATRTRRSSRFARPRTSQTNPAPSAVQRGAGSSDSTTT